MKIQIRVSPELLCNIIGRGVSLPSRRYILFLEVIDVIIEGIITGVHVTEKGSTILKVADNQAVHSVLMPKDSVINEADVIGKKAKFEGFSRDPVFMFSTSPKK